MVKKNYKNTLSYTQIITRCGYCFSPNFAMKISQYLKMIDKQGDTLIPAVTVTNSRRISVSYQFLMQYMFYLVPYGDPPILHQPADLLLNS